MRPKVGVGRSAQGSPKLRLRSHSPTPSPGGGVSCGEDRAARENRLWRPGPSGALSARRDVCRGPGRQQGPVCPPPRPPGRALLCSADTVLEDVIHPNKCIHVHWITRLLIFRLINDRLI